MSFGAHPIFLFPSLSSETQRTSVSLREPLQLFYPRADSLRSISFFNASQMYALSSSLILFGS